MACCRLMQGVRVEQADGRTITVLATTRPTPGEQVIQLRDSAGREVAFRVQPVTISVVSCGEMLQDRVLPRGSGRGTTRDRQGSDLVLVRARLLVIA